MKKNSSRKTEKLSTKIDLFLKKQFQDISLNTSSFNFKVTDCKSLKKLKEVWENH
jgi:hypothetical protein